MQKAIWLSAVLTLVVGAAALADTVVLTDGTIVEGTIISETDRYVRIETKLGQKSFSRDKIAQVIKESDVGSALHAIRTTSSFSELPDLAKELKNAEALYALGRFDEIPARVEPLIGKGAKHDEMRIRWLLIETFERQAKWDKVNELLDKTLEDGREPDKIRAQAHKDLFDQNPGYTLRKVNDKRTADFLSREMRDKGKNPNALADGELMRLALIEYVEQILQNDKVSIHKLKQEMDPQETLKAIRDKIEAGSVNVVRDLPYVTELEKVRNTLYKADAILPGYVWGYELELARTEADLLLGVLTELYNEAMEAYPDGANFPTEGDSNRLTRDGRIAWREACENFLKFCRPVLELNEYMLEKSRPYPTELRRFIKILEDLLERLEQMRSATERNKDKAEI